MVKLKPSQSPWRHMLLCGLATSAPVFAGYWNGEVALAVYGAIIGYLVALNDHFGSLKHRLWVATLTYSMVVGGFVFGLFLGSTLLYWACFAGIVYWLGLLAGRGAELERGFLFATLAMTIAQSSQALTTASTLASLSSDLAPFALYVWIGFVALIVGILLLSKLTPTEPKPHSSLRASFRQSLTGRYQNHIHAFSYGMMALASVVATRHFEVERGYWVTITVLLVMKPDRTQSVYVTLQRLIGTLLAVLLAEAFIHTMQSSTALIFGVMLCATAVPWANEKNYSLVAFFATVMVVFLLELTMHNQELDTKLPWIRLYATLIGCALSLVGTVLSHSIDWLAGRSQIPPGNGEADRLREP